MKKIIAIIIMSIVLASANYAIIIDNSTDVKVEQNTTYVTKAEFYKWAQEMQDWFDINSEMELLKKVASVSELHGYKSENFQINPDDYIVRR